MAGLGSRFPNSKKPKPLIEIHGKTMIESAIDSMNLDGKYIFIIRKDHQDQFNLSSTLKDIYPDSEVVVIDHMTEGPACTALLAENLIDNKESLIIVNCDQILHWDSVSFKVFCENYPHDGFVVTYFANTDKNSYVKLDKNGFACEIKEKEIISNISLNGVHFWKHGEDFVTSAKKMIMANDRAPNGEFYIAPSYNYLIRDNKNIGIYHIPNEQHWAIGTEEDLDLYLRINP